MADLPISGLTEANLPLTGDELVPLVQEGTTKQTTAQDIANLASGGGSMGHACGYVDQDGSLDYSFGVDDVTKGSTGIYTINFISELFSDPPAVTANARSGEGLFVCTIDNVSSSAATIYVRSISGGTLTDWDFTFIALPTS